MDDALKMFPLSTRYFVRMRNEGGLHRDKLPFIRTFTSMPNASAQMPTCQNAAKSGGF